jgi:hypothetical protein
VSLAAIRFATGAARRPFAFRGAGMAEKACNTQHAKQDGAGGRSKHVHFFPASSSCTSCASCCTAFRSSPTAKAFNTKNTKHTKKDDAGGRSKRSLAGDVVSRRFRKIAVLPLPWLPLPLRVLRVLRVPRLSSLFRRQKPSTRSTRRKRMQGEDRSDLSPATSSPGGFARPLSCFLHFSRFVFVCFAVHGVPLFAGRKKDTGYPQGCCLDL